MHFAKLRLKFFAQFARQMKKIQYPEQSKLYIRYRRSCYLWKKEIIRAVKLINKKLTYFET